MTFDGIPAERAEDEAFWTTMAAWLTLLSVSVFFLMGGFLRFCVCVTHKNSVTY